MKHFLRQHVGLLLTCAAFFSVGLLRLNDLSLYNDSDRYVIWGTSIASGKGFVDVTLPTPERYVVNAPFYSVFLAPAMRIFPSSLVAAKVWTLVAGTLALVLFYRWLLLTFTRRVAWTLTTLFAAMPLTIIIATEALSEALFLCCLFYLLTVFDRPASARVANRWTDNLPLLVAAFLPLLREIGMAALIAFAFFFARRRDWRSFAILLGGTAVVVGGWALRNLVLVGVPASSQDPNVSFILQHLVTSSDRTLLAELSTRLSLNASQYWNELGGSGLFLFPGSIIVHPGSLFQFFTRTVFALQPYLPFVVVPTIALGAYRDANSNPLGAWRLVFVGAYVAIALAYPVHDMRFALPLIPFLLFYLASGCVFVASLRPGSIPAGRAAGLALAVLIAIPNLVADIEIVRTNSAYVRDPLEYYATLKASGSTNEYFTHPWGLVGAWVRQHTERTAVFGSASKGLVTFLDGRTMVEMNSALSQPAFERLVCENAVDFIIAPTVFDGFHAYEQYVNVTRRITLAPVAEFGSIRIWSVEKGSRPIIVDAEPDSSTGALVCRGYEALINGDGMAAEYFLHAADVRKSLNASIRFYQLIAATLGKNIMRSEAILQNLFSLPQSTSYQLAAKNYIETQRAVLAARTLADPSACAVQLVRAAQFYWDYGYPQHAIDLARESYRNDPSYFVGLLWNWYYAHEAGNTQFADSVFQRLSSIDGTNAVVRAFASIRTMERANGRGHRRGLIPEERLKIAREFRNVELYDAAFKAAEEVAAAPSASQAQAEVFLAETYQSLGKFRAARNAYERALRIDPALPVQPMIASLTRTLEP